MLGHLSCVIHINDIDKNISGLMSNFVNGTKIGAIIVSKEWCLRIRQGMSAGKLGGVNAEGI